MDVYIHVSKLPKAGMLCYIAYLRFTHPYCACATHTVAQGGGDAEGQLTHSPALMTLAT